MSSNFPGNPWADVNARVDTNTAGVIAAVHLLSYEQRTANLIAYLDLMARDGGNSSSIRTIDQEILVRLGLKTEVTQ